MNILVCIKPDMTGQEIGPFEHLALEAGLVLREACHRSGISSARVDVVTAGPSPWQDCLYRALGTGADKGLHILTCPSSDPDAEVLMPAAASAALLAAAAAPTDYDLILTGIMSQDLMAGQTGPMLARMLGIPCATAVVSLDLAGPETLTAQREMDGGLREELSIPLPALVSIQTGSYTPRYPVLSHMLKARQKPVLTIESKALPPAREILLPPALPEQTREGRVAPGSLEDQVAAFEAFLTERGLL